MQAFHVQEGESIDYTPAAAVASGDVIVQGSLVGVSPLDIAALADGSFPLGALTIGTLFDFVKETGAVTVGQDVWWRPAGDPVGGTVDTGAASVVGGTYYLGKSVRAEGANDLTVRVRIGNHFPDSPLRNVIADPGNAGAIPVTNTGSVQIVTAGAETRTLANPTYVGQQLAISMKTDAGDCVITVAAAINATGNNTVTLNDAGDFLLLTAIENGANKRWKITANDGATLSTV